MQLGATDKNISKAEIIAKRDKNFDEYFKKHIERGKIAPKQTFIIAENVLVFREVLGEKLVSHWTNGFTVEEILGPETYIVSQGSKKLRANKIYLKKDTSV